MSDAATTPPAEAVRLRLYRAEKWMERARIARESGDPDSAFILCWIAFNAAYARDRKPHDTRSEFDLYFRRLLRLDRNAIRDAINSEVSEAVEKVVDNVFLFESFWEQANERADGDKEPAPEWKKKFDEQGESVRETLGDAGEGDLERAIGILFRRLYTLRNQLVHGGATWGSSLNRYSVESGAHLMERLLPVFLRIMRRNPDEDWGRPPYWAGLWKGRVGN